MNETILIVEDDEDASDLIRNTIADVQDETAVILAANTSRQAIEYAKHGNISYCALDLGLPATKDGKVIEEDKECKLGFDVLKEVLNNNPDVEVRVLSRFTDIAQIRKLLTQQFRGDSRILSPLDKNNDGDYLDKVAQDVTGLRPLQATLDSLGMRMAHTLERRLARILWRLADIQWSWPTPRLVLRGDSQMGKDQWARALASFRNVRQPCPDRVEVQSYDLGRIRSAGDSPVITLFGATNYQGIRGSHRSLFEEATSLGGNGQPNFNRSNFAILSELGNLPADCQPLLLELLREGFVTHAGAGNRRVRIGCGFIFTTNARLEERVVRSDAAGEQGFREDLFNRLNLTEEWIFVPSFKEMGCDAFLRHLRLALEAEFGTNYEIAPIAEDLIKDAFNETDQEFTHASIQAITHSFVNSGSNRLTGDHLKSVIRRKRVAGVASVPKGRSAEGGSRESLREEIKNVLRLTNLRHGWNCDEFAKACRGRSFDSQQDFQDFVEALVRIGGLDRNKQSQRDLFTLATGYAGPDLLAWLAKIRKDITDGSGGKLEPVNRLKNSGKSRT